MEARLTRTARLDHIDAEEWQRILDSPLWARYEARVKKELERAIASCQREDGIIALRRAQGAAAAIAAILGIPVAMLGEMKKPRPANSPA